MMPPTVPAYRRISELLTVIQSGYSAARKHAEQARSCHSAAAVSHIVDGVAVAVKRTAEVFDVTPVLVLNTQSESFFFFIVFHLSIIV